MLPGPIYLYKCPHCGELVKSKSYMSTNNFGARYYSDGRMIAEMSPDIPRIVPCNSCDACFWLEQKHKSGEISTKEAANEKSSEIEFVRFPTIYEYESILENKNYNFKDQEIYLRQKMWWSFNDRIREGLPLFSSEMDCVIWDKNAKRLIKLFKEKDITQKIMIAELYRNMGDFKKCMKKLDEIKNHDYDGLKEAFRRECDKGNTEVFKMN